MEDPMVTLRTVEGGYYRRVPRNHVEKYVEAAGGWKWFTLEDAGSDYPPIMPELLLPVPGAPDWAQPFVERPFIDKWVD